MGCAVIVAGAQKAGLVFFMSVGVPGEAPSVLVPEIANAAEMDGGISKPLDPLLRRFTSRWPTSAREIRFSVRVNVAERAAEPHINSSELSAVVLGSVGENTPFRACFDGGWDALPTGVRIIDPHAHSASPLFRLRAVSVGGSVPFAILPQGWASAFLHAIPWRHANGPERKSWQNL